MESSAQNNLNNAQQRLLRTFKYLHNEKELNEIQSLINFYLEKKLDEAIIKVENERNYTAEIYEEWLNEKNNKNSK